MTFDQAIYRFQEWKSIRNERASITYVWEVSKFRRFIKKDLFEITEDDVTSYQALLKKTKADNTQAIAANALRAFFGFLNKRGLSKIDPLDILVPRIEEKVPIYVTAREFEKIVDVAKYKSPIMLLAVRLLWFTGVRVSELCDIEVAQCNLGESYATIRTRKAFKPKQIFWDEDTNELLKGVIQVSESPFLFASPRGGKINPRQIERWIQELVKKAKIHKHITPHSFRHGATKEWLNNKVDLPAIKDFLGHKNLMSIEKYTKRLDDDIKEKGREAVRQRVWKMKYDLSKLKGD